LKGLLATIFNASQPSPLGYMGGIHARLGTGGLSKQGRLSVIRQRYNWVTLMVAAALRQADQRASQQGLKAIRDGADHHAANLAPSGWRWGGQGVSSLGGIAALNQQDQPQRGWAVAWSMVSNLVARLGGSQEQRWRAEGAGGTVVECVLPIVFCLTSGCIQYSCGRYALTCRIIELIVFILLDDWVYTADYRIASYDMNVEG